MRKVVNIKDRLVDEMLRKWYHQEDVFSGQVDLTYNNILQLKYLGFSSLLKLSLAFPMSISIPYSPYVISDPIL